MDEVNAWTKQYRLWLYAQQPPTPGNEKLKSRAYEGRTNRCDELRQEACMEKTSFQTPLYNRVAW
jgi:hypothetical protein